MPTYTFRCEKCGSTQATIMGMRAYCAAPPAFICCAEVMGRFFETVPALALHNALASERHYDGLRATDGTPIDTRAKHRAYMRERGLTTVDDYRDTWAKEARARDERMQGIDPTRAGDLAEAIARLGA